MGNDIPTGTSPVVYKTANYLKPLFQVTDVEKKFTDLDILHKNGWIRMETLNDVQAKKSSVKTGKTKTFKTDAVKSKSGIRSHIESMRRQKNDLIV